MKNLVRSAEELITAELRSMEFNVFSGELPEMKVGEACVWGNDAGCGWLARLPDSSDGERRYDAGQVTIDRSSETARRLYRSVRFGSK